MNDYVWPIESGYFRSWPIINEYSRVRHECKAYSDRWIIEVWGAQIFPSVTLFALIYLYCAPRNEVLEFRKLRHRSFAKMPSFHIGQQCNCASFWSVFYVVNIFRVINLIQSLFFSFLESGTINPFGASNKVSFRTKTMTMNRVWFFLFSIYFINTFYYMMKNIWDVLKN